MSTAHLMNAIWLGLMRATVQESLRWAETSADLLTMLRASRVQEIGMIFRNGGASKPQGHHLRNPNGCPAARGHLLHSVLVFLCYLAKIMLFSYIWIRMNM